MDQFIGKIVKILPARKVGSGTVISVQLKDLSKELLTVCVWNELGSKMAVNKVVEFINLRVDKYPPQKPHNLRSTAATRIEDKTEELEEEYRNIGLSDGKIKGTVECFYEVYRQVLLICQKI